MLSNDGQPNENIKGGSGKIVPDFIEPMNSPYHTTGAKQIHSQKIMTQPYDTHAGQNVSNIPAVPGGPPSRPDSSAKHPLFPPGGKAPQPIIDLQIYPEPKKVNPLAEKQGMLPLQPFALSSPFIPPQFQSYLNNFMKTFYTPFIYKDYHINLSGPSGDHSTASMIYEDALPTPEVFSSYKTLRERNALGEYIRGTFIKADEGELVDFSGGPNSLNSRLKLIQLNPYNTNMFSPNPYKGLPKNLLIYKSCYPIVYDKESTMVQCNKLAVGMNIRVYKLNLKEFIVKYFDSVSKMSELKLNEDIKTVIDKINIDTKGKSIDEVYPELKSDKYDVWREVSYYAWIRNKVNISNNCPNFVSSYCYFINKDANLSFKKNGLGIDIDKNLTIPEILEKEFTNSTMILLTESPNQNIYQWGSNIYVQDRGIRKMIYSGFKPETHWRSIIAQMFIIFYLMDKFKFTIREMDINSNFYIKDLNVYGDNKQYWQYTIENIDYYIPNHGHLVMLDHNYKDLTRTENIGKNKIIMGDFGDDSNEIFNTIIDNAINCFHPNNFGSKFLEIGGVGLSPSIGDLFNQIEKDLIDKKNELNSGNPDAIQPDQFWSWFIRKYLINYVHNRAGTPIRDLEVIYIRKIDSRPRPFKVGELVVWEEKFENYKILLVIENKDPNYCKCISKNLVSNEYIITDIPKDLMYHYSEYEPIKQDGKLGEPIIGYETIIERYIL